MDFFRDTTQAEGLIRAAIEKYGSAPKHNYEWYEYTREPTEKNVLVSFEDGMALLTCEKETSRAVYVDPLAPKDLFADLLLEYLLDSFCHTSIEKVILEIRTEDRINLLSRLPKTMRVCRTNYSLVWPLMNMDIFDPTMPGKKFKHIRRAKHKTEREHAVEICSAKETEKEGLHRIVEEWRKKRGGRDKAWIRRYHALIDADFRGTTSARTFLVDGVPHGFNAGWSIPNSNWYYGAVGIHDYFHSDLGLLLYLEDLEWVKANGYSSMDTGGGGEALTGFKNKFGPESFYTTEFFSIKRT